MMRARTFITVIAALAVSALLALGWGSADAQSGRRLLLMSGGATPYLGQVATGTAFPDTSSSTVNKNTMSRSAHVARDNITSVQVGFANWLVGGTGAEQNPGGTAELTASIEYPSGTFTQLLFGGTPTANLANGATIFSDAASVAIPNGSSFWVRIWFLGSAEGLFKAFRNTAAGDAMAFAASGLVDQTLSGTVVDGGFNGIYRPIAIIAQTKKPSIFIAGDSRPNGANDTYSGSSTFIGDIARSIGPSFAYINGGTNNAQLANWLGGGAANRLSLVQYCSHVINELGINDFNSGGKSAAQMESQQASFRALLGGKPLYLMTLEPFSSSTDS